VARHCGWWGGAAFAVVGGVAAAQTWVGDLAAWTRVTWPLPCGLSGPAPNLVRARRNPA
jgi:hypothetical protein